MSDDGAQMGVSAERALGTILGGDPQPNDEECMTADEMRAMSLAAPFDADDYGGAANAVARVILEAFLQYPPLVQIPTETPYLHDERGQLVMVNDGMQLVPIGLGLYDVLKGLVASDRERREVFSGITGFQWGWAVNAARRCVELPEVPNPAIMTIGES